MQMTDKIILDTKDYPEVAEYFSRREAGDKCKGTWEASLDENSDGKVVLSIDDFQVEQSKADKATKKGQPADDYEAEPEPASAQLMKAKQDEADTEEPDEATQ